MSTLQLALEAHLVEAGREQGLIPSPAIDGGEGRTSSDKAWSINGWKKNLKMLFIGLLTPEFDVLTSAIVFDYQLCLLSVRHRGRIPARFRFLFCRGFASRGFGSDVRRCNALTFSATVTAA